MTETVIRLLMDGDQPAVYQCLACNTILSDSTRWEASMRQEYAIVVSSIVNCTQSTEPKLEQPCFSVIFDLLCSKCQTIVGKTYKSTPAGLDSLRDKYLLNLDQLTIYHLGGNGERSRHLSREDLMIFNDGVHWHKIDVEIAKLKSFCCVLHQSIQTHVMQVKSE